LRLVLYANVALQGAIAGMQACLENSPQGKRAEDESSTVVAEFAERQRPRQGNLL